MENKKQSIDERKMPFVSNDQLTIALFASDIVPGLINPDFLRYNEIVDPDWKLEPPVFVESGHSQFSYSNGLSLKATKEFLFVSHLKNDLSFEDALCREVVRKYMQVAPPADYDFIGIDPTGSIQLDEGDLELFLPSI